MTTAIITNNVPRDVLLGDELTAKELEEFGYLDADEIGGHSFFRYRGEVYDLGEFMVAPSSPISDWDGYLGDSAFSGVVFRYAENCERVIVGRAIVEDNSGATT